VTAVPFSRRSGIRAGGRHVRLLGPLELVHDLKGQGTLLALPSTSSGRGADRQARYKVCRLREVSADRAESPRGAPTRTQTGARVGSPPQSCPTPGCGRRSLSPRATAWVVPSPRATAVWLRIRGSKSDARGDALVGPVNDLSANASCRFHAGLRSSRSMERDTVRTPTVRPDPGATRPHRRARRAHDTGVTSSNTARRPSRDRQMSVETLAGRAVP